MTAKTTTPCRLCESEGPHNVFEAHEMMYGSRESFAYFECSNCGTVQLVSALSPEELVKHYPSDYYSFSSASSSALASFAQGQRDRALLRQPNLLGGLLARLKPELLMQLLGDLGLSRDAAILDVGCGAGLLLDRLGAAGFRNLHGADAFIDKGITTKNGAVIVKADIKDVPGSFDLIMFHHSLEHVPNPLDTLREARKRLNAGGYCLVRVPTVSSAAWEEYGVDWFQLDAPRHIVLPSRKGLQLAAEAASFGLIRTVDDSHPQQFEISENYRAGIPLRGGQSLIKFTSNQKRRFAEQTAAANAQGLGDQAAFVLRAT